MEYHSDLEGTLNARDSGVSEAAPVSASVTECDGLEMLSYIAPSLLSGTTLWSIKR